MKSVNSTPSSAQKSKRSHLGEFLPLYKKFEESKAESNKSFGTYEKRDLSSSKIQSGSPNHQQPSIKLKGKKAMDMSLIIIDEASLKDGGGNTTPLNKSRVTSTPHSSKKSAKANKKSKNTPSDDSMTTANDVSLSNKSHKRSKSVSFLIEENDQAMNKKTKSDDSQDDSNGDTPHKVKKNKKNKKTDKENKEEQTFDEPVSKEIEKKKFKSAHKSKPEEHEQSIPDIDELGDGVVNDKKIKRERKKKKLDKQPETDQVPVKPRKAKKQKHQHIEEDVGEPAPKSPKTEFLDNLENLNLGDNTHTLTNLIDEMAVVDKEKKKKQRKTENRDKKHNETGNNQKNQNKTEIMDNKQKETENTNETGEALNEKKKWDVKRWNKHQLAERARNTTVNVDNLPVSLLKGNFKKVLIDHFSKYGKTINIGEAVIQNENDSNPVFTTKVYFDSTDATVEALEMNGSILAGNKLRVSAMRPMTETALVIRIYDHPEKLTHKDVLTAFGDVGLIRSIKPVLRKKKSMTTAFVEFDGPEAVERALQTSANITIGGKKVMASPFTARTHVHISNDKKIKKKKGANKAHGPNNFKSDK